MSKPRCDAYLLMQTWFSAHGAVQGAVCSTWPTAKASSVAMARQLLPRRRSTMITARSSGDRCSLSQHLTLTQGMVHLVLESRKVVVIKGSLNLP